MRIRILSARGGHRPGDEIDVEDSPEVRSWLGVLDAEIIPAIPDAESAVDVRLVETSVQRGKRRKA